MTDISKALFDSTCQQTPTPRCVDLSLGGPAHEHGSLLAPLITQALLQIVARPHILQVALNLPTPGHALIPPPPEDSSSYFLYWAES